MVLKQVKVLLTWPRGLLPVYFEDSGMAVLALSWVVDPVLLSPVLSMIPMIISFVGVSSRPSHEQFHVFVFFFTEE